MSDFNITLNIDPLLDNDNYATITNSSSDSYPANDLGQYFNLVTASISHSIVELNTPSSIVLQIKSKVSDAISRIRSGSSVGSGDVNLQNTVVNFLDNLSGRPIRLYMTQNVYNQPQETRQVYNGFITSVKNTVDAGGGTQYTLTCMMLIGQLTIMTANGSWNDSTKTYDNIFTSIIANTVDFGKLKTAILQNSLLEGSDIVEYDMNAKIPSQLWAYIPPFMNRLDLLKILIIPYSKIIFQRENGEIAISPLFINDYADDVFNIDAFNNSGNNYVNYAAVNNAGVTPNRVDVIFGVPLSTPGYGLLSGDNDIFCSAPYIPVGTNKITPSNVSELQYTDVYSTSTALYNSGKFIMPVQKTMSIDNVTTDSAILNSFSSSYNSGSFTRSIIYASATPKFNTLPQIFSQIYLAEINAHNYNAAVTYDYKKVFSGGDPLGKIVTLTNMPNIDYNQMLVVQTKLNLSPSGSFYELSFAPMLSITGIWRIKQ